MNVVCSACHHERCWRHRLGHLPNTKACRSKISQNIKQELAPTSWLTAAALCLFAQAAPRLPQAVTYVPAGTSAKLGANYPAPAASDKSSRPAAPSPLCRMERSVRQKAATRARSQWCSPSAGHPGVGGSPRRYSPPPTFSRGSGEHRVPAGPAAPSTASSGRWLGPGCPTWCRIAELRSCGAAEREAGGSDTRGLHPGKAIVLAWPAGVVTSSSANQHRPPPLGTAAS